MESYKSLYRIGVCVEDRTNIEVWRDQKDQLDELKNSPYEPYKAVLQRLIEDYRKHNDD